MNAKVGTVAIGGINLNNAQRVIYQSQAAMRGLNGVAIVSAIMAADDPRQAASSLLQVISKVPAFSTTPKAPRENETAQLLGVIPELIRKVATTSPLCHNIINFVVANFAANVALAMYVHQNVVFVSISYD